MKLITLALGMLVLTGCSVLGIDNSPKSELEKEKSAWLKLNVHSYQYDYRQLCFCGFIDRVVVSVRNDSITSVVVKDTGQPAPSNVHFYTIPQLYDYLIDVESRAAAVSVEYDHNTHLPINVVVDLARNAVDDEFNIETGNFVVLTNLSGQRLQ